MDREGLLAAIREAPADDAPRLIYADWLSENGEENYGEFIRVQCALARPDCPSPTCLKDDSQVWVRICFIFINETS